MRRLVAAFAIAAFLAACSDSSSTAPTSPLRPGGRLNGDPPPPPLSGAGFGFLGPAEDLSLAAVSSLAAPVCPAMHTFNLTYTISYLLTNTLNNEMAHLDIVPPSPASPNDALQGQVTMHDLGNGKSDAKGRVTDSGFAFDITAGDGELTSSDFHYTISGTLTDLTTGAKCQASTVLSGFFTLGQVGS